MATGKQASLPCLTMLGSCRASSKRFPSYAINALGYCTPGQSPLHDIIAFSQASNDDCLPWHHCAPNNHADLSRHCKHTCSTHECQVQSASIGSQWPRAAALRLPDHNSPLVSVCEPKQGHTTWAWKLGDVLSEALCAWNTPKCPQQQQLHASFACVQGVTNSNDGRHPAQAAGCHAKFCQDLVDISTSQDANDCATLLNLRVDAGGHHLQRWRHPAEAAGRGAPRCQDPGGHLHFPGCRGQPGLHQTLQC